MSESMSDTRLGMDYALSCAEDALDHRLNRIGDMRSPFNTAEREEELDRMEDRAIGRHRAECISIRQDYAVLRG